MQFRQDGSTDPRIKIPEELRYIFNPIIRGKGLWEIQSKTEKQLQKTERGFSR
jgi:hypothetical protein